MASRLSYFLWNTMPDVALFAAAEAGDLTRKSTLALQVQRMLDDPRAHDGVRAFFSDQFDLDQLDEMTKDPLIFKHMSSELGPAAREETLTVIEDLLYVQNGDYRDLLTTQNTWVDRRLASIYDIAAPNMDGFGWVELPTESRRRGLLGQVGVLALNAHAVSTSVTQRGVFVRERLLCQSIPAPPADVDTSIPEVTAAAATMRERVAVHLQDPTCAVCHQITDPMGLGLENFDGIGRWRTRENEAVIDASGELDGVSFADGWELSQVVAEHQDLGPCLVASVFRYASGRGVGTGERDVVRWHSDGFLEMEHRVRFAMRDIALGPAFRLLGEASDEE